jgi:hypothetical protein
MKSSFFISVQELVESGIAPHGPFGNMHNTTSGGLAFVKADPDEPSYLGSTAIMRGPTFQNSDAKCILVRFGVNPAKI